MFNFKIAFNWCSSHFEQRKKEEIEIIPVKTTAEKQLTRHEDTFLITFAASFLKHRKLNAQFITHHLSA